MGHGRDRRFLDIRDSSEPVPEFLKIHDDCVVEWLPLICYVNISFFFLSPGDTPTNLRQSSLCVRALQAIFHQQPSGDPRHVLDYAAAWSDSEAPKRYPRAGFDSAC